MEWNFLFRIDHLNQTGEERNLKGLVITDGRPPTAREIQDFLVDSGFRVNIEDSKQFIFMDPNPKDPVKITVVRLDDDEEQVNDPALKLLAKQFQEEPKNI